MALSAFDDKRHPPGPEELELVLGKAIAHWDDLLRHLHEKYPPAEEQWGFSGQKWGWGLRVKQRKRVILYMTPQEDRFYIGFALGEKAARAALDAKLPMRVAKAIEEAPRYAEGRGLRLDVRRVSDLKWVRKLAAIKMAN